jgi:hypothetical protein
MKIVKLTAENIKKLRAVEITPNGQVVTISGRNGQGKTSVLDSIFWALTGTKNIQSAPIRKGETKARVRLELGDLVVERKFTPTSSALSVESVDGARFPSPQTMLDKLIGELSFDPLAFARMDPKKQFDELRRVAKVEVDFDKLKGLNRSDYERRTEINREAKARRARADGIVIPPEISGQVSDESALVDELEKAGETNAAIEKRKERRAAAQAAIEYKRGNANTHRKRAAELRAQADQLDAEAQQWIAEADELVQQLANAEPLPEPIDTSALRGKIANAQRTNRAIADRAAALERKQALAHEAAEFEKQSRELTERIESREKAMQEAIAQAAMPVEGLGFGDGHVTLNGIPFDQASSAEQLRVSMSIAMAANPKLRVIRITDGSLLDEDSLAAIGEMAKAADFQVWIETVDSSGTVGVVIEDGAVASTPETRAAMSPGEQLAEEDRMIAEGAAPELARATAGNL